MANAEPCGVCGESETKLVDGFYYCAECGTQNTNLQETIVEHMALADGTFGVARRTRYSVKIKEGVKMPPEWYKWHRHNFLLAGLTEQLIELGAAPSVRMKVLWIWTRYIKKYQKKDEMGPSHALSQLQQSSSSSEAEDEEEQAEGKEEKLAARVRRGTFALNRVSSSVLLTILALALNIDRSPILVSHITRFARYRLLTVTDVNRLVPPEILHNTTGTAPSPVRLFFAIPYMMTYLAKHLDLGPPVTPDINQMLASQLRELRLPRALAELVRALMHLAPVTFDKTSFKPADDGWRFPDYEAAVMAYVVVALKMCFGLDDDYELRLSDAVERVNEECNHPRAYSSAPEPTPHLFSFRSWALYIQLRTLQLTRHYAPLAWLRGGSAGGVAALEHFQQFTSARNDPRTKGMRKGAKARVTDQVTMEILNKIPNGFDAGVLSLDQLKPAAAALEPQVALARAVGPLLPASTRSLLDEDFTQYSLDYAYRHLRLPDTHSAGLFRGVRDTYCQNKKIGEDFYSHIGDPTIVYIKNCSNKNWARTKRPTTSHIAADDDDDDDGDDSRETAPDEEETKLETFDEETEGANIYDDDFADIQIKEEKTDSKDDADVKDETKVETDWINEFENFDNASRRSCENKSDDEMLDLFDSDEEDAPPFDPGTFNRWGVIKEIMATSYKKLTVRMPARFQNEKIVRKYEKDRPSKFYRSREHQYGIGIQVGAIRLKRLEDQAKIEDIIATYRGNLTRDILHQVEEQVRASTRADHQQAAPDPEPVHTPHLPDPADVSHTDPMDVDDGDVEIIENDGKDGKDENIEDEFDEHAYDPIFKSDAKYDEKTHDIDQLFVKMTELPKEPQPDNDDDADIIAIIDKQIQQRKKLPPKPKTKPTLITTRIDHLVEDPERVGAYNYWVAQVADCTKISRFPWKFENDIKASCPRSFWFVLWECAAAIGLRPAVLYSLVARVEGALLNLLPEPPKSRGRPKKLVRLVTLKPSENRQPKKKGRPRKNVDLSVTLGRDGPELENQEPRKRRRPRKHMAVNPSIASDLQKKPEDGRTLHSKQSRTKTVKPRKDVDLSSSDWQMSTSESGSSDSGSGDAVLKQEQPRKRGKPRKQDDDLLVTSDLQKSKEGKIVHSQQHWKMRERPHKNKVEDPLESRDSHNGTTKRLSSYSDSNPEVLRKTGRPHKNKVGVFPESSDSQGSTSESPSSCSNSSPEIPRKKGRVRKSIDGNRSGASDSQVPEARLSEDGRAVHSPQNKRNRRISRKHLVRDDSEESDSQESTSVSPSLLSDSSEEDETAWRKPELPGGRGLRESMDGSLSVTCRRNLTMKELGIVSNAK